MPWLALAAAMLAASVYRVGTLSVWTFVLSSALKGAILAAVVVASATALMVVRGRFN